MKHNKLQSVLYIIASLLIIIPIIIVLTTEHAFSALYSHILLGTAFIFIIAGRVITIIKIIKVEHIIPWNKIGFTLGILITLIWRLLD